MPYDGFPNILLWAIQWWISSATSQQLPKYITNIWQVGCLQMINSVGVKVHNAGFS